MQKTAQTALLKSLAQTPHSARYTINTLQPNLSLTNTENISLREKSNQNHSNSLSNWNDNIIQFKNKRDEIINQDCILLENNGHNIQLINSTLQRIKASELIKNMYASRGYCSNTGSIYNHNQMSFAASNQQRVIGTLTIGQDSKDGLLADTLYKRELEMIRAKSRKVYELTKLAIDPQHSSKELLASLFNIAYISARIVNKATDFVIEVNPRHAGYYKRLLGFNQIGELRICPRVNAPAVLLHLDLDYVDAQVACLAGTCDSRQKSIYTYFLTKHNEKKVANKIQCKLIEEQLYYRLKNNISRHMLM